MSKQVTLTVTLELTDEAYDQMQERAYDINRYRTAQGADEITVPELLAQDIEAEGSVHPGVQLTVSQTEN